MTEVSQRKKFLHFFPAPEFLLLSTTGVTLSDKTARVIQFRRKSFHNQTRLTKWGKCEFPEGAIENGFINNPDQVASSLKELATKHNLNYVRATLPDEKAYLFTAFIDKVPEKNLRDAVAFIIEENVPLALAKATFDFKAFPTNAPNKLKVVVSVVHRKVIDAYTQVFSKAGMTVIAFDIDSQAVSRAVISKHDRRTTIIVKARDKKVSFYVVEKEVVQFSTTSSQDMFVEGEAVRLSDLKTELQRVITFWNSKVEEGGGQDKKIERIILCGPAINTEQISQDLNHEFALPCDLANPWINTISPRKDSPILSESLGYVSAIGMSLSRE